MFNMLVEPEKIIDFSIQNGLPCYQVRWCDSWIPQDSLSSNWQHLVDVFWKAHTVNNLNLQQQLQSQSFPNRQVQQELQQQPQQQKQQEHNQSQQQQQHQQPKPQLEQQPYEKSYTSLETANKFLPTFSSLLISNVLQNTPLTNIGLSAEQNVQNSLEQPFTTKIPSEQSSIVSSSQLKNGLEQQTPLNIANFSADFQINNLLPPASTKDLTDAISIDSCNVEKKVEKTPSNKKNSNRKNSTRIIRKKKQKKQENDKGENTTTEEEKIACNECHRDFSHTIKPRKRLREHIRRIHLKNGKFQCTVCSKTFVCRQGLRDHEPVHSKERNHCCSYCGQTFLRSSHLYIHVRTHEEEKNFRCEACFDTFNVQSELKEHCDQIHTDITIDVKCSVCKQNLYSAQSIYSHSLRHSGTRDFKCDHCGMAFKRKQTLDDHTKTHLTDKTLRKKIKCDVCSKEFTTKSTLREHMFLVHKSSLDGADHKCQVCGKCFQNWPNYERHSQSHSNIKEWISQVSAQENEILENCNETDALLSRDLTCNACKAVFTSEKQILLHLQQHQNITSVFDQEIGEQDNLVSQNSKQQAKNLGESSTGLEQTLDSKIPLTCIICQKDFSQLQYLKKHMVMHTATELKCNICFMMFKRRDTLRIHTKRHYLRKETAENFTGNAGERYNERKELHSKIGNADNDGQIACPYCEKIFKSRKLLLAHIVLHSDFVHTCEICGKTYKQRSCFNKHKRGHTNPEKSRGKRGRPKKDKDFNTIPNEPT